MLSWNCCGLGNPITVQRIKEIRQKISPDIIFLSETKNDDVFVLKELEFLSSDKHFLLPPSRPGSGGLALFWRQDIDLQILSHSHNYIDALIVYKGCSFHTTFIYGEPDHTQRHSFWELLSFLSDNRDTPWLLTGDFNEIVDNSEKSGGPIRAEGSFTNFRNFLASRDLFDLKHSGNYLSWRGKRHNHLVYCRLDRTIANSAWSDMFPSGRCHYMEFGGSDHRPIISYVDPTKKKVGRLFRYDRRLSNNPEIKDLIMETWNSIPNLPVSQRLSQCRFAISRWSKRQAANSKERIETLKAEVETAMVDPSGNDSLIARLNGDLLKTYRDEEEFWRQRSRLIWLAAGDRNSGYFHAVCKAKRARNRITVLETASGSPLYEDAQIVNEITSYFQEIFTSNTPSVLFEPATIVEQALTPCISEEVNETLISIPSTEEIRVAMFSIHPDKAPGPDGFSACFFQSNWSTVGAIIVQETQEFFRSGCIPEHLNDTHVRLIPKIQSPKLVSDYRPIALCNVVYKLISKILTLRLKPILHGIISETQSGFVPGRAISDNILITHETLHNLKTSNALKNCSMAVKTDMSKAYDRLEWSFIQLVLERLGFHSTWTARIMTCIRTVSYAYLVNDSIQGAVVPTRGIRQGDPLSPYLFILCSEVLSVLCRRAQQAGLFTGIRVARGSPRVHHLLFADDTMFFIRSDERSCDTLLLILQQYEAASGQTINPTKSSITFSAKTTQETRARVKSHLGIAREGGVGKYLGLPEHFGRRKKDLFTSIVDRIRQQASSWSNRALGS